MTREEAVVRARGCIGARFRLHGRDAGRGLDCVGVVVRAYVLAGAPSGYALRGGHEADALASLARHGFRPASGAALPGDLLLLRPGPFQLHLAIMTEAGFVHADAGLRRVVETPGRPRWPLVARLCPSFEG